MGRNNDGSSVGIISLFFFFLAFVCLLIVLIGCKRVDAGQGLEERVYTIRQELYSVQGVDSVETIVFVRKAGGFVGVGVYNKKNSADYAERDREEAVRFIEKHKSFNNVK